MDPGARPTDGSTSWIRFRVGDGEYALPLDRVVEVSEARNPRLIPLLARATAGVVNLRGEPLPVVGAASLLGIDADAPHHALVLERRDLRVGLLVNAISRIERGLQPAEPERLGDPREPDGGLIQWSLGRGGRVGLIEADLLLDRMTHLLRPGAPRGETPCPTVW